MTNRYSILLLAWVTIALIASDSRLAADEPSASTSFDVKPDVEAVRKYSGWMSRLPDHISLSEMSIPGTHDSCALHNGFSFGFAKCQAWSLDDQLEVGIRFLDIRCRHVGETFQIYHGAIDQQMTFADVRDVCRDFLRRCPTECIVMSIKEESTSINSPRSFFETFRDETQQDGELWVFQNNPPTLGEVRGRIVVLDRVGTLHGLPWRNLRRQDDYQASLSAKADLIRSHLKAATESREGDWFVNFCSGTLPSNLTTPSQYARTSNRVAFQFLKDRQTFPAKLGTIVMDFPGESLIGRIIESNFEAGAWMAAGKANVSIEGGSGVKLIEE